jgi:desulfoferrodoxin-like iron-binding protein
MTLVGKRYKCESCGSEILVTKAGAGEPWCCGDPMELLQAKKLPSSD